jgi:peptidoglycan hydrolase-like protein with peptidoglycan-binding domain
MVASTTAHSTLIPGSYNNDVDQVRYLQQQLNLFYHSYISAVRQGKSGTAKIAVDGMFGSKTTARVKQFQSDFGLSADGIVGDNTWTVLESELLKP